VVPADPVAAVEALGGPLGGVLSALAANAELVFVSLVLEILDFVSVIFDNALGFEVAGDVVVAKATFAEYFAFAPDTDHFVILVAGVGACRT